MTTNLDLRLVSRASSFAQVRSGPVANMADHAIPDITLPAACDFPSERNDTSNDTSKVDPNVAEDGKGKEKAKEKLYTVPFFTLFAFADKIDILLITLGSIGAIGNGVAEPLTTLLFGSLANAFGNNQGNQQALVHAVSKVRCLLST